MNKGTLFGYFKKVESPGRKKGEVSLPYMALFRGASVPEVVLPFPTRLRTKSRGLGIRTLRSFSFRRHSVARLLSRP